MTIPVLIVNYNGREYLADCLGSLTADSYTNIDPVIYVVDNNSTDGSVDYMRATFPKVRIIQSGRNTGFAEGNMIGWDQIQRDLPDVEYLFLLNQDTIVTPGFMQDLVDAFEAQPSLGSAQPMLLLHPKTDTVNSLGTRIHFLGFGYSMQNGVKCAGLEPREESINYASGAAVLLRTAAIRRTGLFDPEMFMYLEDLDLGWRLRLAGYDNRVIPSSIVYHKYAFSRGMRQFYFFERNRLWILLKNYRIRTLVLLFPAWFVMECAQLVRSAMTGTLGKKLWTYVYFVSVNNVRRLFRERGFVQRMRTVSDRALIWQFTGRIEFQPLDGFALRFIANPFFSAYHWLIKHLIVW